jgi:ribosomal protein S18 acetylase RimI-like enzyme
MSRGAGEFFAITRQSSTGFRTANEYNAVAYDMNPETELRSLAVTDEVHVRNTEPRDFTAIADLCQRIYPDTPPWTAEQLASHLRVFPEGQFVAVHGPTEVLAGMCASLVVDWEHYNSLESWEQFTADGMFTNHDPRGRTLYGAEVIVDPTLQHHGVGDKLYRARRELAESHKLLRIRAGARLCGYCHCADRLKPDEYVFAVIEGKEHDATLSFQLREGFHVLAVVPHYLSDDPESLGYAAVIEWLNPLLVRAEHVVGMPTRFMRKALARDLGVADGVHGTS